jgi:excisionase family DNA binding protein
MPEQVDTSRVVLSTAEASKVSGFDPTYIQRLLRQERIEGFRVGAVWLVYEDSLKVFMAQPRKRGPKGPHKKSSSEQSSSNENA